MSLEAFRTFLESNPEALEKVKACSNHDEVAAIAKANGIDVSGAEVMKAAALATAELDDDALEAVAGGRAITGSDAGDVALFSAPGIIGIAVIK